MFDCTHWSLNWTLVWNLCRFFAPIPVEWRFHEIPGRVPSLLPNANPPLTGQLCLLLHRENRCITKYQPSATFPAWNNREFGTETWKPKSRTCQSRNQLLSTVTQYGVIRKCANHSNSRHICKYEDFANVPRNREITSECNIWRFSGPPEISDIFTLECSAKNVALGRIFALKNSWNPWWFWKSSALGFCLTLFSDFVTHL